MADVLNRVTRELRRSVNTVDYDSAEWLIVADSPDLVAPKYAGRTAILPPGPSKYWVIDGDKLSVMDDAAKAAVDEAEAVASKEAAAEAAKAVIDEPHSTATLSWLVGQINELRAAAGLKPVTLDEAKDGAKAAVDDVALVAEIEVK